MRADGSTRYNLRFELDIPLVRDASRAPSEVAIEHHQVALVRLGDTSDRVIARADLFRICPCSGENVLLAAEEIGCGYLAHVCARALAEDGSISAGLTEAFSQEAVSEVHALTRLEFFVPDEEDPLLRVLFVRAILDHISHGFEALFVEDEPDQLHLWEKTIGARGFGDLIVAAAGYRLPDLHALLDTSVRH